MLGQAERASHTAGILQDLLVPNLELQPRPAPNYLGTSAGLGCGFWECTCCVGLCRQVWLVCRQSIGSEECRSSDLAVPVCLLHASAMACRDHPGFHGLDSPPGFRPYMCLWGYAEPAAFTGGDCQTVPGLTGHRLGLRAVPTASEFGQSGPTEATSPYHFNPNL